MAAMTDAFIDVDEVQTSPRGRSKVLDQGLLDLLATVPEGKAIALAGTFGKVAKEKRQAVAAVIRKHWTEVQATKPRIDFSPEGVPQVRSR